MRTVVGCFLVLSMAAIGCDSDSDSSTTASATGGSQNNCNSNTDCQAGQTCQLGTGKSDSASADCEANCTLKCALEQGNPSCLSDCLVDECGATPSAPGPGDVDAGSSSTGGSTGTTFKGKCVDDSGAAPGTGGQGGQDIEWAGTWTLKATYTSQCIAFQNKPEKDFTDSPYTLIISGSNADLTGEAGGLMLAGNGTKDGLTLAGQFPLLDDEGTAAGATADSKFTFSVTTVTDSNHASGTFQGKWSGGAHGTCEAINNPTFTLSR